MKKVNKNMDRRRVIMQKIKRLIRRKRFYILAISIGLMLVQPAIYAVHAFREYGAIGWEFLFVALLPLLVLFADMIKIYSLNRKAER